MSTYNPSPGLTAQHRDGNWQSQETLTLKLDGSVWTQVGARLLLRGLKVGARLLLRGLKVGPRLLLRGLKVGPRLFSTKAHPGSIQTTADFAQLWSIK